MKRTTKIALWVCGSLFAFFALAIGAADTWISYYVNKKVSTALEQIPDADASVGRIHVLLFSGTAVVKDLHFASCAFAHKTDTDKVPLKPGFRMDIPTLSVGPVNYVALLRERSLSALAVTIDEPTFTFYLDEKHPERSFPVLKDTTLEKAHNWLQQVNITYAHLNKLSGRIKSTRTALDLHIDDLTTYAEDLTYLTNEQQFLYNDSAYLFRLGHLCLNLPDGSAQAEINRLEQRDQGPLTLGYTRFCNTRSIFEMADKAQEPTSWIDIEINSLYLSAFNPIRKALNQDYSLDSIFVNVKQMHVKRDERHNPKAEIPTPQEFLRQIPTPFAIQAVQAEVQHINIEMYLQRENCGKLQLQDMSAHLNDVTNREGHSWLCQAHAPIGEGVVDAQFNMHMDKASHFDLAFCGKNINASFLNPFIRPLVGLSLECQINQIDAEYQGNRLIAMGEYCMQYHGLKIQAHKDDNVPFSVITKYANTITNVANSLLTKSNPSSVDVKPRRYYVEWQRDPWKAYPLYLFGPCINGTVETLLPGLYVHKQIQ